MLLYVITFIQSVNMRSLKPISSWKERKRWLIRYARFSEKEIFYRQLISKQTNMFVESLEMTDPLAVVELAACKNEQLCREVWEIQEQRQTYPWLALLCSFCFNEMLSLKRKQARLASLFFLRTRSLKWLLRVKVFYINQLEADICV